MPTARRRNGTKEEAEEHDTTPLSIPPAPVAQAPAPVVKRNTVDVINSKISYDTVIPVDITDNAAAFIAKCKPYDIIEGRNPFDDEPISPLPVRAAASDAQGVKPEPVADAETTSSSTVSTKRRKRSRSPGVTAGRRRSGGALLKSEPAPETPEMEPADVPPRASEGDAEHFVSTVTPSPLLASVDSMPTIPGWAAARLSDCTPYQLETSKDVETRVKYILDDGDYDWCRTHNVSPQILQRSFTFFEWAYVSFLLSAVQGDGAGTSTFSPSTLASVGSGGGSSSSSSGNATSGGGTSGSGRLAGGPGSPTTAKSAALRNFLAQAKRLSSTLCAVCAKPVHVLASTDRTRLHELQATESLGLRCSGCGVIAHLQCWYLPALPPSTERWRCDGCHLRELNGRRAAFSRCAVCGRDGNVLLPYRARDPTATAGSFPVAPSSPHDRDTPFSRGGGELRSPASPTSTAESGVCHVVCALAFPELIIRTPVGLSAGAAGPPPSAATDTALRPFVVPTRRIPRQVSSCIYCAGAACPTVQCQHPRCYEPMHPSCAAEHHTLECFTLEDAGRAESVVEQTDARDGGERAAPRSSALSAAPFPAVTVTPWSGALVYCRKHFGYNINRALGSAALAEKAEAQALHMDLHSVLRGLRMTYHDEEDDRGGGGRGRGGGNEVLTEAFFLEGTLPVARAVRRGPGRPSAAELRQRAVETTVIADVRRYWQQRRAEKRRQSAALAAEINFLRSRPILAAALRPELIKISASKVRLSHFLCLIPEWQQMLVALVEGELPLADDEYDDVQRYRKASAHTRRSGNTAGLYQRMVAAHANLVAFAACADLVGQQAATRSKLVEAELRWCDMITDWSAPHNTE